MFTWLCMLLYVIVCIFLILVVLLQTGRRADLAGAFGGGSSQTAFGARGAATMLAKLTTASAVAFMLLALTLSILSSRRGGDASVLDEVAPAETGSAPLPGAPPLPAPTPADAVPQPPSGEAGSGPESPAPGS